MLLVGQIIGEESTSSDNKFKRMGWTLAATCFFRVPLLVLPAVSPSLSSFEGATGDVALQSLFFEVASGVLYFLVIWNASGAVLGKSSEESYRWVKEDGDLKKERGESRAEKRAKERAEKKKKGGKGE